MHQQRAGAPPPAPRRGRRRTAARRPGRARPGRLLGVAAPSTSSSVARHRHWWRPEPRCCVPQGGTGYVQKRVHMARCTETPAGTLRPSRLSKSYVPSSLSHGLQLLVPKREAADSLRQQLTLTLTRAREAPNTHKITNRHNFEVQGARKKTKNTAPKRQPEIRIVTSLRRWRQCLCNHRMCW